MTLYSDFADAPETKMSPKSDVFALGLVGIQWLCQDYLKKPTTRIQEKYQKKDGDELEPWTSEQLQTMINALSPGLQAAPVKAIFEVLKDMINFSLSERPSMLEVASRLKKLLDHDTCTCHAFTSANANWSSPAEHFQPGKRARKPTSNHDNLREEVKIELRGDADFRDELLEDEEFTEAIKEAMKEDYSLIGSIEGRVARGPRFQ